MSKQALVSDFKFGALLQVKANEQKIRVLNNSRGDEFDAVFEGINAEMVVHSRDAGAYLLIEDGEAFKPCDAFMTEVRVYT